MVDFGKLLGEPIQVEMPLPGGGTRHFHGISSQIARGGGNDHTTSYTLELVPRLWLLTKKANCRIFQNKSVPAIIAEILDQAHIVFEPLRSASNYPPLDYCVQYNETDADFISRLMEKEGIYYHFHHSVEGHKLVLMDSSAFAPAITAPTVINYGGARQANQDVNRISKWRKSQRLVSGKRALCDYTMHKPRDRWQADCSIVNSVAAGKVEHQFNVRACNDLEMFHFPGEFAHRLDQVDGTADERDRTASVRSDELALPGLQVQGTSTCRHFTAGHTFTNRDILQQHHADGEYLLTGVEHSARPLRFENGRPVGVEYFNSFACIPLDLKFRPQRVTRLPTINGVQTARVVGPKSGEGDNKGAIHVDRYGRIKVKFHWDRSGFEDDRCSAWIRVGQGWASGGFGIHFWPRVGDEVIVAFENGDPDRPIIVGSVYNHDNMPPYALPDEKTKSGIKTKSTNQGDVHQNYNELRFEDQLGGEQIYLHAERNLDTVVENNETLHVFGNRSKSVSELEKNEIKGGRETSISGDLASFAFPVADALSVDGTRLATIEGDDIADVKGQRSMHSDGRHDITSLEQIRLIVGGSMLTLDASGIELSFGANSVRIDAVGVFIDALNAVIKGQMLASVHAPLTNITADGATTVNSPLTNILSSGPLILKGAAAGMTF